MSDTTASLRRQITSASDLQSVVRTMKALAASSIGQYETSVRALADYYRTVELGLSACLRAREPAAVLAERDAPADAGAISALVFGSDQGLVGQFNDVVADYAIAALAALPGQAEVWAVGERVHARLADAGLPLDDRWRRELSERPWLTRSVPDVMGSGTATLGALIREYLFVSLFRACAESLASENASRLAAMQRADKNIDELLETLNRTCQRLRQSGIDEELFDVVAGFEALSGPQRSPSLFVLRLVQEDLDDPGAVAVKMRLEIHDGTIPLRPDGLRVEQFLRQPLREQDLGMHANDEHFLVVGAIEDATPRSLIPAPCRCAVEDSPLPLDAGSSSWMTKVGSYALPKRGIP